MHRLLSTSLVLVGLSSLAGVAHADPHSHDGFYLGITGGLGYYHVSGSNDASISGATIPNIGLMLGTTVTKNLVIGGGAFMDYSSGAEVSQGGQSVDFPGAQMVIALGAFADYYMDPSKGGLHFQGFLGWGGLEETEGTGGSDPTGLTVAAGAGYDLFISDEWSVGGMARIAYGAYSLSGQDATTIAPALLGTLTWH